MEEMRWILLVLGGLLVLGIYLFGIWSKSDVHTDSQTNERIEPSIINSDENSKLSDISQDDFAKKSQGLIIDPTFKELEPEKQFVVTVRLVAINNSSYAGDDLVLALREHGMQLGEYGIFHYYKDENKSIIFSAASLVEPGTFDLKKIKDQKIPGITFFMSLPLAVNGIEAFDEMLSVVKKVSITLKGELLDESGSSFSIQRERYIREQVIEYLFEIKKQNSSNHG
jgi:cell division protein ZipA